MLSVVGTTAMNSEPLLPWGSVGICGTLMSFMRFCGALWSPVGLCEGLCRDSVEPFRTSSNRCSCLAQTLTFTSLYYSNCTLNSLLDPISPTPREDCADAQDPPVSHTVMCAPPCLLLGKVSKLPVSASHSSSATSLSTFYPSFLLHSNA